MTTRRPARTSVAAMAVVGILIAGCTRPEDSAPADDTAVTTPADTTATTPPPTTTTTPPTDTATTSAAPTTSAPSTSAPATTTTAAPATTSPSSTEPPDDPSDLVLTFDSIGPFRFGDRDVDVVPALAALLGPPIRDDVAEYPVADEGSFFDAAEEESYVSPFGRTVCFANTLCAQFGAGAPETRILTGWRMNDSAPSDLVTDTGVGIGATWADHADVISVDPFDSCLHVAYADSGGVEVVLQSSSEPFAAPDEDGEFVPGNPDPAEVTVVELQAGRHPIQVFVDC